MSGVPLIEGDAMPLLRRVLFELLESGCEDGMICGEALSPSSDSSSSRDRLCGVIAIGMLRCFGRSSGESADLQIGDATCSAT